MKLGLVEQSMIVVAIIATILFCDIGLTAVFGQISEDQLTVCNFEDNCKVVNIDDYMTKQKSDKLFADFKNNIDTFGISDMTQNKADYHEDILIQLDDICRDQYYKFCFGDSWNSLRDALN